MSQVLELAPTQRLLSPDRELVGSDLNRYIQATVLSINSNFTSTDSGIAIAQFDPSLDSYNTQTHLSTLGNIGDSLIATACISDMKEMAPVQVRFRNLQILATLEEIMNNPDCYNGQFIQNFTPEGLPYENSDTKLADPWEHAKLLKGLEVSKIFFPERTNRVEKLLNLIRGEISENWNYIPDIKYDAIPQQTHTIPIFKTSENDSIRPADIIANLSHNPALMLQTISNLIAEYPDIFDDNEGFMTSVNRGSGLINRVQTFEDKTKILVGLRRCKYMLGFDYKEDVANGIDSQTNGNGWEQLNLSLFQSLALDY